MFKRGQTFTEYVLVIICVAVVAFGAYRILGNNIASIGSHQVDSELTNA